MINVNEYYFLPEDDRTIKKCIRLELINENNIQASFEDGITHSSTSSSIVELCNIHAYLSHIKDNVRPIKDSVRHKSALVNDIYEKGLFYKGKVPFSTYKNNRSGYNIYQHPDQLACLIELMYEHNVKSYVEIGLKFGGTFRYICEKLYEKVGSDFYALGCDARIVKEVKEVLSNQGINVDIIQADSKSIKPDKAYDCVFIDGDHSFQGVSADFNIWKPFTKKMFVLHDICNPECPGVVRFWKEIKSKYKTNFEFTMDNLYGIGVVLVE